MADLDTHVFTVTGSLAKGGKGLEVVDDVFRSLFLDATLDVFLTDIWIVGPNLGPRSAVDVLRTVTRHVLVTYIRPNESMVRLETVDVVKGEETTAQNSETGGGPNTIYRFSLLVGSARSGNTLTTVIAYDGFVHSYLHQSFRHLTVSDIVVGIHSQDHVVTIIT